MDKAFKEWCAKMGITPRSHDYSIAKAAWQEAIKKVIETFAKASKGDKQ
jgi:hypothetical protein